MARIAVAGFQHETNTFSPIKATIDDFIAADAWPPLCRGRQLLEEVHGINLPIDGFITGACAKRHDIVPLTWCSAEPSGPVTNNAFEYISGIICADLLAQGTVDAIFLDLHGAMVTEQLEDGEGELIRRIRAIVGPQLPIVASLDYHANVTMEMVNVATMLVGYRTYPHVDMAETGARCASLVDHLLRIGRAPKKAFHKLPFLIPLTAQCTLVDPNRTLQASVRQLESGSVLSASFTPGFAPADIRECGPSIMVYADSQDVANQRASDLYAQVVHAEGNFVDEILDIEEAITLAMQPNSKGPVVLADTQDNPGAGGTSDTVGILEGLIRRRSQGAIVALLCDPEVVALAKSAGEGVTIECYLGGKVPGGQSRPYKARVLVEKVRTGSFVCTGPVWLGSRAEIGPVVLLQIEHDNKLCDVRVIVSSKRFQAADQAIFHHVGIEPALQKIIALKSSVHFRADFEKVASKILVVRAPGVNPADSNSVTYERLRPNVRLSPNGPIHRPRRTVQ
jgi:microcystin degradation protein MlrC